MERDFIGIGVNPCWVIRPCFVKEQQVKDCGSCNDEREQEVKGEKSCQSGVVNGESASNSLYQGAPDVRNSGKKVCNYSGSPEGYLSSWEDVAYECSYYSEK